MSLEYAELNNQHLILSKPSAKQPIVEGLDINAAVNRRTPDEIAEAAQFLEQDLSIALPAAREYDVLSNTMNSDNGGRVYSQNPNHSTVNPVNDPISHEYIPRINEAALADVQSRLEFQNRVYAYTAVGLISVIIGGIMFNSTK